MFSAAVQKRLRETARTGPLPVPVDVQVLPLNNCNARCDFCPLFCYTEEEKQEIAPRFIITKDRLALPVFQQFVADLARHKLTERLHFTGGEPLMHPDLVAMAGTVKTQLPGCHTTVVSNGILLERHAEALAATGLDKLSISLNSGSPESFEALHIGRAVQFERVLAGMRMYDKARNGKTQQLAVTAVLNNKNHREIQKMVEAAIAGRADVLTIVPLVRFEARLATGEAVDGNEALVLTPAQMDEVRAQLPEARALAQGKGLGFYEASQWDALGQLASLDLYKNQPCYTAQLFSIIHPDGSVRGCCNCETVLGNINEDGIEAIWRNTRYEKYRGQTMAIATEGPPPTCACHECGYIYENQQAHQWVTAGG